MMLQNEEEDAHAVSLSKNISNTSTRSVFTNADSLYAVSASQSSLSALPNEKRQKKPGFFKRFLNVFKRKGRKQNYEQQNNDWDIPDRAPSFCGSVEQDMCDSPHMKSSSERSCSSVPELVDEYVHRNLNPDTTKVVTNSSRIREKSDDLKNPSYLSEIVSEDVSVIHQEELQAKTMPNTGADWKTHMLNVQVTYNGYALSPAQKNWLGKQVTGLVNILLDKQCVPKNMSFVDDGVLPAFVPRYEGRSGHMSEIPKPSSYKSCEDRSKDFNSESSNESFLYYDALKNKRLLPHSAFRVDSKVIVEIEDNIMEDQPNNQLRETSKMSDINMLQNCNGQKKHFSFPGEQKSCCLPDEIQRSLCISETLPSSSCSTNNQTLSSKEQDCISEPLNVKSVSICPDLVGNKNCAGSLIGFCGAAAASGSMQEIQHDSNVQLQDLSSSPDICFVDMRNKNTPRQKQKRSLQKMKSSRLPRSTQKSMTENFSFSRSGTTEGFEHFPINYQGSTGSPRRDYQSEEKNGKMSASNTVLGKSPRNGYMISTDDFMTMSEPSRRNIDQCSPFVSPSCSPALKKRLINLQQNSSEWREHTQNARFTKLGSNTSSESINCALAKPHFNFHNCLGTSSNIFPSKVSSSDESLVIQHEFRNPPIQDRSGASTPRYFSHPQHGLSDTSNRDRRMIEYVDGNQPRHFEQFPLNHRQWWSAPHVNAYGCYGSVRDFTTWKRNRPSIRQGSSPRNFQIMPMIPYPTGYCGELDGAAKAIGPIALRESIGDSHTDRKDSGGNARETVVQGSPDLVPKRRKWRQCLKEKNDDVAWWMPRNWAQERGIGKYGQTTESAEKKKDRELEIAKDANVEQIRMCRFVPL